MSDLARQQSDFQRSILTTDDAVLAEILDSPKEKRGVLFGVYRHAYGSRLAEAMRNDHDLLHLYLGDEMFDAMAQAYIAAHPSQHPNVRWFSRGLPQFLKSTEPYSGYSVLADLCALEQALNDAFDAEDAPVVSLADMAGLPPQTWADLRFEPHPSVRRLDVTTNASPIWIALKSGDDPPDAVGLEEPGRLLVWRRDVMPMFRELTAEETMMWDEAAKGVAFGVLCAMLATRADPDGAAAHGAGYLQSWITGGLLSRVSAGD